MANTQLSPASLPMSSEDTKPYACTACVQRKVKCDKRHPCLSCGKSRIQCRYRDTPPPQRRKRKIETSHQTLLEKLRAHEANLRRAGLPFETFEGLNDGVNDHEEIAGDTPENPRRRSLPAGPVESSGIPMQRPPPHRGILVCEHGGRRYYDHGMIGALGQEYRQDPINTAHIGVYGSPHEAPDILASSVLTGTPSMQSSQQYQHPPPATVMKYWSISVDNVHPLTKIVHAPTLYRTMVDSASTSPNNTDALRYSIYACAVASLTDKECQRTFGESHASLLYGWQSATRNALLEASFLRVPNIDLLRAHMLFLTSMLNTSDPSTLWLLMGSTIRMAQSQGLHRDGALYGLPPFEIEMRRRLWWYIVTLDGRLSELIGSESCLPKSMDNPLPSNVNDSDLEPDMTVPHQDRTGASEMTFCLLKYEATRFQQQGHEPGPKAPEPQMSSRPGKQESKRSVSDLESFLEEKFLRFCDPVIPMQFLTTTIARSTLCKLRQMAHHRRSRPDPHTPRAMSPSQNNRTLNIATRNIEYDNLIHSSRSLRGYLWHVNFYFPWGAPVFILKNLASKSEWDEDMQVAWTQIEELYEHHPEYLETDKVTHLIIGGLVVKAWQAWKVALESTSRGMPKQRTPDFVTGLRARLASFWERRNEGDRMGGWGGREGMRR